jgi:hypothetical protein
MTGPGRPRRDESASQSLTAARVWPEQFSWALVEAELDLANVLMDVANHQQRSPANSGYRRARQIYEAIVGALGEETADANAQIEALKLRLEQYVAEIAAVDAAS